MAKNPFTSDPWFSFPKMKIFGGKGRANPRRGGGGGGYVGPYDPYTQLLPAKAPSGLRVDRLSGDMVGVRARGNVYYKNKVWDKHSLKEHKKDFTKEEQKKMRNIMNNGGNHLPKGFALWLYGKDGEKRPESFKGERSADFLNRKLEEFRREQARMAEMNTHAKGVVAAETAAIKKGIEPSTSGGGDDDDDDEEEDPTEGEKEAIKKTNIDEVSGAKKRPNSGQLTQAETLELEKVASDLMNRDAGDTESTGLDLVAETVIAQLRKTGKYTPAGGKDKYFLSMDNQWGPFPHD